MKIWVGKNRVKAKVIEWSGCKRNYPIAAMFNCPKCNTKQWYKSSELYVAKDQSINNIKCKNCNTGKDFLRYQNTMLNFFKKTISKFKKTPKPVQTNKNNSGDLDKLHNELQQLKDLIIGLKQPGAVTNITNITNVEKTGASKGSKAELDYDDSMPIFIPSSIINKDTKGEIDIKSKETSADNLDEAAKILKKFKKRKKKIKQASKHITTCEYLNDGKRNSECLACKTWI